MSFGTIFAVRTPANKNSHSAMITGSTLGSVACASTAAGGVSCTDVSAAHPLITPAISAIAINFFIVVHPLLKMRHPDNETCTKSKCVRDQSAKTRRTICCVANSDSVRWSAGVKHSFMTMGGAVASDRVVLAAKRKTLRQPTSCTHQSVRHKLAWSLHPFRINGRID